MFRNENGIFCVTSMGQMHRCLISFGANIGDARGSVLAAERMLVQRLHSSDNVRLSRLYQTPPVGGPSGQEPFVNAVAALETRLTPWEVWHVIRTIEQQLGRERVRRWEARRIDLDILLYDQLRIWSPQLKIPHPRMCMRRFILQPAADVAADWLDPVSQVTIGDLATRLAQGVGSLILAGPSELHPQQVLQQPALCSARLSSIDQMLEMKASVTSDNPAVGREVAHANTQQLLQRLSQPMTLATTRTKLIIFWESISENCAWEDQHRQLAIRLRLADYHAAKTGERPLPLSGPRYLLATSDTNWAAHEVAAALDAMDCPLELFS